MLVFFDENYLKGYMKTVLHYLIWYVGSFDEIYLNVYMKTVLHYLIYIQHDRKQANAPLNEKGGF